MALLLRYRSQTIQPNNGIVKRNAPKDRCGVTPGYCGQNEYTIISSGHSHVWPNHSLRHCRLGGCGAMENP
ncbi:uncharacterized protein BDCG_04322 [Blastomyces dermatitidis ER-3]|uniref:Uncharacterized protein n=3 Tax=Blastomyces TaxID=229219 RepID=A0A179UAQ9_BLAGS|nr:uncharacterized protein BDBG_01299 [Blastomyces gilchristii SLH14081]XP_045276174.1 uncharacterized protein BDCG_04322 [Blastomyces dermatitidis ER-3]EGE82017.2 hypothetical protein BDDG_04960 [Blastomyces dermatitidis ATCC 18188]EQL33344.1 hypothetical protein BDFG_04502 [Blastomyces dermatitidis ATCC 26199]EEQ89202.2 hypothetical protein BDCG_04322 [Blastomyces dermatitidis ER-3]OAT04803.1 hypothetical protein BDBG_01299 [Blastomyces gilchristii SLH14081]